MDRRTSRLEDNDVNLTTLKYLYRNTEEWWVDRNDLQLTYKQSYTKILKT